MVVTAWAIVAALSAPLFQRKVFVASVLFFLWLFLWFLLGWLNSGVREEDASLARVFLSFALYAAITGLYLAGDADAKLPRSKLLEGLALLLLTGWVVFIYREQAYVEYAVRAYGANNYLTISDLVAVLVLVTVFGRKLPLWFRGAWIVMGLLTCLLLGSRTTLVALGASLLIGALVVGRVGAGRRLLAFFGVVSVLVAGVLFFLGNFDESVTYRFQTLFDLHGDASLAGRDMLFDSYLRRMQDDPMCLFLPCFPDLGNYAHNIFSLHQYFGLGGIAAILFASFALVRALMLGWTPPIVPLLFFCVVEVVLARAWMSIVFPILVGYVLAAIYFLVNTSSSKAGIGHEHVRR